VTQVGRSTWGASGVPSYVSMYIYVPDQVAPNPPVVVACHSCGTPVSGYQNSIQGIRAGADRVGFIIILPEATGQNCWDVGSANSLTHEGGGDTEAIAQMVRYVLQTYDGDASRVYVLGGSSGAMMTQALMAVYPDVFRAGSARAGVAAGCWADGYSSSNQWSNNCAGGNTTKSAEQWGDQARGMYQGYMGDRPRLQLFHGTADTTINYRNMAESIKQWTNVLGLPTMATRTGTATTSVSTYDQQFWEDECGDVRFETWAGRNGSHSMAYEEDAILDFFGLNQAGTPDPEADCSPAGGAGGMGGMAGSGMGGASGGGAGAPMSAGAGPLAGSGGISGMGGSGGNAGIGGVPTGSGGSGFGGSPGAGSSGAGTGGSSGGASAVGGAVGTAGGLSTGGTGGAGTGGSATAGTVGSAGSSAPTLGVDDGSQDPGCGCVVGERQSKPAYAAALALGLFALSLRRRRRAR
jgi:poly(hydroxyalkanoate) depolymerase family esterase